MLFTHPRQYFQEAGNQTVNGGVKKKDGEVGIVWVTEAEDKFCHLELRNCHCTLSLNVHKTNLKMKTSIELHQRCLNVHATYTETKITSLFVKYPKGWPRKERKLKLLSVLILLIAAVSVDCHLPQKLAIERRPNFACYPIIIED